jgi:hypothetical protein
MHALVVKWISLLTSDQSFQVRVLAGALKKVSINGKEYRAWYDVFRSGYSLVVEQLVANQLVGVRFSLSALLKDEVGISLLTVGIKDRDSEIL